MGRIKTQLIKRITKQLLNKYGAEFTADYEKNKPLVDKYVDVESTKLRNVITGYATRLTKMKQKE